MVHKLPRALVGLEVEDVKVEQEEIGGKFATFLLLRSAKSRPDLVAALQRELNEAPRKNPNYDQFYAPREGLQIQVGNGGLRRETVDDARWIVRAGTTKVLISFRL